MRSLPGAQHHRKEGIPVSYSSSRAISLDRETETGSVAEILRLLSSGAACAILLALGEGPMRSKVLTHRIQGYTPRTIYRYLPRLAALGLVERDHGPGGAAGVVHTLREDGGVELRDLIDRFAAATETRLPDGQVKAEEWSSLGLLADLWEAGVVEELSRGPRSPTELAKELDLLSYHQLNRRASRFEASGFLQVSGRAGSKRRSYALSRRTARAMALVAGIGRWLRARPAGEEEGGLTAVNMATALRVALPLATAPRQAGKEARLLVGGDGGTAELSLRIGSEGSVSCVSVADSTAAWAAGEVEDWLAALLDGEPVKQAGGDYAVVADLLTSLYERLWTPSPF